MGRIRPKQVSKIKRIYIAVCFLVTIAATITIYFYVITRTHYLNYDYEYYAGQEISHIGLGSGIKLKGYSEQKFPYETIITDKRMIKQILDYLNSIPLVPVSEDELLFQASRQDAKLMFYNESGTNTGWIYFKGEEYLRRSLDGKVFKVRDEGMLIVNGLENLDFDKE